MSKRNGRRTQARNIREREALQKAVRRAPNSLDVSDEELDPPSLAGTVSAYQETHNSAASDARSTASPSFISVIHGNWKKLVIWIASTVAVVVLGFYINTIYSETYQHGKALAELGVRLEYLQKDIDTINTDFATKEVLTMRLEALEIELSGRIPDIGDIETRIGELEAKVGEVSRK